MTLLLRGTALFARVRVSSWGMAPRSYLGRTSVSKEAVGRKKLSEIKRLWGLIRPERHRLTGGVGLLFVSSAVTMTVPFALGRIVDTIYQIDQSRKKETTGDDDSDRRDFERGLRRFCLGLTGVFALGGACNFGRVYLMRVASQNIAARIRTKLYSSLMRRDIEFFDRNRTGELINRLSADTQLVSQTITQQVSDGLRAAVMTGAGVGMMVFMSPQLTLVGMSVVPPVALFGVVMGRKVRSASRTVQDSLAASTQLAEERLSNIRTVNAFARQPDEICAYEQRMQTVLNVSKEEALIHAKFYGMTGLSGNMIILSVLYYGGSLVTSDAITVGNLASFVLYAAYVGIGLSGVSSSYAEVMKGLGASARIFEIVDEGQKEKATPITASPKASKLNLNRDIVFQNVHFSYPTRLDTKVFDGLNLTIPANKVLAVVGKSGSGKSTLASLLLRYYEPQQGTISIGGQNIADIDVYCLRKHMAIVAQEPVLFSSSIKENILYGGLESFGDVDAKDAAMRAATESYAHDFIIRFPDKYDTLVGERGVLLSGGQKQRVAIARAIIREPQILLLDEATSALDAAGEHEVKLALEKIMKGRTVITIAHRLSTIMNADNIIVLQDGRVVESGTFEELNSKDKGIFRQLVKRQTFDAD